MSHHPDLYLFACSVQPISQAHWQRTIILFFVDADGQRRSYAVSDYWPSLLVQPMNPDFTEEDIEQLLQAENQHNMADIEIREVIRTPLVGFTNHRQDRLFKIRYRWLSQKYLLRETITRASDGHLLLLHENIPDDVQFLHEQGWRLQRWYRHTKTPVITTPRFVDQGICATISINGLHILPESPMIPPIAFAFVRLYAHSSTATRTNIFNPDHNIPQDRILAVSLRLYQLGVNSPGHQTNITHTDEREVLRQTSRWFRQHSPCFLLHMSDPFDQIAYLHFRARHHGITHTGLSATLFTDSRVNTNRRDDTFRDLTLNGREAVDLVALLQKYMISPPLDGYTLADVIAHPKLIRDRARIRYEPDALILLKPDTERESYMQNELDVMVALQNDNNLLINNLPLSSACDASLFTIISRGQQCRAFRCFARWYHDQNIYINHPQFLQTPLVVRRPRQESSFPDPPWLDNPPPFRPKTGPTLPTKKRSSSVMGLLGRDTASKKPTTTQPAITEKRYGGGFVVAPDAGVYRLAQEATATLDFASLYPSIIRGYKICYMRVVYDAAWLDDPLAEKQYIPIDNESCYVFIVSYNGRAVQTITDHIIADVMSNRQRIKGLIKTVTDPFQKQTLQAMELCCKVLQNGCYGAMGSETFALPCMAVAATVCAIGQWMNKTVRYTAMTRGCRCVYGDTDSVMLQFPTTPGLDDDAVMAEVYRQARALEHDTTSLFPPPNAVEFESIKRPFIMTSKKKTYAALEYPPGENGWRQTPQKVVKGFMFKKRDYCEWVGRTGTMLVDQLLHHPSVDLVQWVTSVLKRLLSHTRRPTTTDELQPFVISCRLAGEYKVTHTIALELAKRYEQEFGIRPPVNTRLRYVVVEQKNTALMFRTVPPITFLQTPHLQLDMAYYLEKQLAPPLIQLLDNYPMVRATVVNLVTQMTADCRRQATNVFTFIRPSQIQDG